MAITPYNGILQHNTISVTNYDAPEYKQDVFARKACPAFLTFTNAAYLAGVTVELPCHCKPQQVQSVVWFFRKHLGGSEETTALTDHHGNKLLDPSRVPHSGDLRSRFSIRLFSLLIFRAGPDDAGVYICGSDNRDFFYGYDLDIQEKKRVGSAQPLYRIFSSFRPWSVCDRCGAPGEQVRVGLCYVHSKFLHVRYRKANQTTASCGSGAVPEAFEKVKRNKDGANSGSTPAEISVYYLNHPADRVLTLGCPGARPNMAVAWDRGPEPIYRFDHSAGGNHSNTNSRLLIDTGHHLVFQPAKAQDSGVYYCWLQGRRAAEIRLLIYAHFGKRQSVTSHPDFLIALRTVFRSYAIMSAVFCLLLICRVGVTLLLEKREAHVD
uniref:Family with sequence similarity 187 member A n=1 Tax=Labrus bergylta TaxID=56723 RepID=A0A3Q3EPT5_9LABR